VQEQVEQLRNEGCVVQLFLIVGKGWLGYLRNRKGLMHAIKQFNPNLIHAHSGMSVLLAALQRRIPVVATFHGSDINIPKLRRFSKLAMMLSRSHIVVSTEMKRALNDERVHVIPCAVDTTLFYPTDTAAERKNLGWKEENRYILFSSAFSNTVKNAPLAQEAIEELNEENFQLVELKGKSRREVAQLLNACDVALMTSFTEGSPQFIKEAMACAVPVVSTLVGDVPELSENLSGHFLVEYTKESVAEGIRRAIEFRDAERQTKGPEVVQKFGLTPHHIAQRIMDVYSEALKN
jgi:glycosyltransferase involved in cell wall biosynthesis